MPSYNVKKYTLKLGNHQES